LKTFVASLFFLEYGLVKKQRSTP